MPDYDSMYPTIDIGLLERTTADSPARNEVSSWFEIQEIINPLPHIKNCISASLFYQNVDNQYPDQHGKQDINKWNEKYYHRLIKFIQDFRNSNMVGSWKIRVYLENCLLNSNIVDINHLLSFGHESLEIYHMRCNSIGAQPGMLWRFLAYDDRDLTTAFVCDIDDSFSDRSSKIACFYNAPEKCVFGRYLSYSKDSFIIDKSRNGPPLNYATVIGCMNGIRPQKSDISIKNCIINYILWRMIRATSAKPSEEFDDRDTHRFSEPIGNQIYGWGGHWTVYGFDERFLKHVVFPHFARRGEIFTWTCEDRNTLSNLPGDNPVKIDYDFCMNHDNVFFKI